LHIKGGNIKASVKNLKQLNRVKAELDKIIITPEYQSSVGEFAKAFNTVSKIQNTYFATLTEEFTVTAVLDEIKRLSIEETVASLTEEGLSANVTNKIYEVLSENVKSGSRWVDMNKEIRNFIAGNEETAGVLERYSGQITTDAINEFSANYTQIVTEDLGLKWSVYAGSLVEGSRDLCKELINHHYIHESEIPGFLKGEIGNKKIPVNPKTNLPYGMKAGTTKDNFRQKRGGHQCNHQMIPVAESFVPKEIREKFEE